MRTLMQSFLAVAAVLALAPNVASAIPPSCYDICGNPGVSCDRICWARGVTTCGEMGFCGEDAEGDESSEVTKSVLHDDQAQKSDASAWACNEGQQMPAASASVER